MYGYKGFFYETGQPDDPVNNLDRSDAMAEAVQRTPREFAVNELCGQAGEYEDDYIHERREADRERRW